MKYISNPKRLPRKYKKMFIKSWGRSTYHNVMKGITIIAPYVIEYQKPQMYMSVDCEEELIKLLKSSYATKMVDNKFEII